MSNLLFWLGPDSIWSPKGLIEKFMAYELPDDLKQEYRVDLAADLKRQVIGENTPRLYGIEVAAQRAILSRDGIEG